MDIQIGKSAKTATVADKTNTALAVGSGSLEVFATPMMIALMEKASCEVLSGSLNEGQTSVGINISVEHTSASSIGTRVFAAATVTAVEGRKVSFDVTASDEKGVIGKGTHTRLVIDSKRFMDKLQNA